MCVDGLIPQLEVDKTKTSKGTNLMSPIQPTQRRWQAMFARSNGWKFIETSRKLVDQRDFGIAINPGD
jgi:hypothetical protein